MMKEKTRNAGDRVTVSTESALLNLSVQQRRALKSLMDTLKMTAIRASRGLDQVSFVHRHICDRIFVCTSNCTQNNATFKGCASN